MGKAITGAAELAGAIGMGALAFFQPELAALPGYAGLMGSLALSGLSAEAGAVAGLLTSNRGQNITTRQAAGFRQIVYGTQRIGGNLIYCSTTGSHLDQYNRVIVLATHEISAITGLYLDGRLVYWIPGRTGYTTYGGSDFGGDSDGSSHTGPDGSQYNFGDSGVYCEVRFGNQADGDVIGGLTANDPAWAASSHGSPWVGGCSYAYLKIEYNQTNFPSDPEIKFTVLGKPVYDPRTGTTGYSSNPALIINDILTDPVYGLNDTSVNQAALIAAANICEEEITLANGQTEDQFACHWHYDTSTAVGDVLTTILQTMQGRLSRVNGQWVIQAGAWVAPAASFNADHLTAPVQWSSTRSSIDLFNEVRGTYTAPNYPYNIAGNYYDANGFANGAIQNNYGFAFQPTSYPAYACDTEHGYASDEYLTQDGGVSSVKELGLPAVLSIAQAQRLAKIELLRNRWQGTGTLQMTLAAWGQLQPGDTFNMTFAPMGWADKVLEVTDTHWQLTDGSDGQAPKIVFSVDVAETDPTVYEWSTAEEQTVYDVPAAMTQAPYTPAAPTSMALLGGAGVALLQPDGTVIPRIEVTWNTPLDVLVTQIQMQYQLTGATTWTDAGTVDVSLNNGYISPIVSGQTYDVRIRSLRANGASSAWVELDGFTAGLVLNVQTQDGIGIGSLFSEAFSNGTAAITCDPFSAMVGNNTLSYFPSGAVTLSGLSQQTLYFVYVVDTSYAGGNLTPVATTNQGDYLGKLGYFLIDSLVTGFASGSGSASSNRYAPSSYTDVGTRSTQNPTSAYDGSIVTFAIVGASATSQYLNGETTDTASNGSCTWSVLPNLTTTSAMTLTVAAAAKFVQIHGGTAGTVSIVATVGSTSTTLWTGSTTLAQTNLTLAIGSGTNLSTVSVSVTANPGGGEASSTTTTVSSACTANIYEIYVS